jgi:hypothetical protein
MIEMTSSVMTTVDHDLGRMVDAEVERNGIRGVTGQRSPPLRQMGKGCGSKAITVSARRPG